MTAELDLVRAWHDALNRGDVNALVELVAADVEIGGPRGITRGADVVREWFGRANIRLTPLRYFAGGSTLVVEEGAEWHDPDTGQVTGAQTVATVFAVAAGVITRIARYDDRAAALAAAGLSEADAV